MTKSCGISTPVTEATIHEQKQGKQEEIPNCHMQSDYEETCNPDHICPCNFNGFPTYGNCGALVAYYVREANYGDVKLDGHSVYQAYINLMGNYFDLHLKRK